MIRGVLRIGLLVAIGVAIVASVTAQEPAPRAPVPNPDKDKVVVVGCLQRAAQLPVGTTGAIGDTDVSKFILMKAPSPSDAQPAAATRTYRLDADDSLLTTHVGHKVEITGTLESAMSSTVVTGDPAPPAASATKLKVISVKMIAAACE
jgi:hypothetical protein